jgi:hypothetical protein
MFFINFYAATIPIRGRTSLNPRGGQGGLSGKTHREFVIQKVK